MKKLVIVLLIVVPIAVLFAIKVYNFVEVGWCVKWFQRAVATEPEQYEDIHGLIDEGRAFAPYSRQCALNEGKFGSSM